MSDREPALIRYMTATTGPERDAAYLEMIAADIRLGRPPQDIPNTLAATIEGIAKRIEKLQTRAILAEGALISADVELANFRAEGVTLGMGRELIAALAGPDPDKQKILAEWDRENELRRNAERLAEKLRSQVIKLIGDNSQTKPCQICQWPQPMDDEGFICECCGFEVGCNDVTTYKWDGKFWGTGLSAPPAIVRDLQAKCEAMIVDYAGCRADWLRAEERIAALTQQLMATEERIAVLEAATAKRDARRFPIMGGPSIPWDVMAPCEHQAQRNHSQSIGRLAERGGLSPCEAVAVLEGRSWARMDAQQAIATMLRIVAERQTAGSGGDHK